MNGDDNGNNDDDNDDLENGGNNDNASSGTSFWLFLYQFHTPKEKKTIVLSLINNIRGSL